MRRERIAFGRPVYPSPTARRGQRVGRTPYRLCKNCGAPNDTRRVKVGVGDTLRAGTVEDGTTEFNSSGGCNFCASHNWLHGKPGPLKDEKRLRKIRRR